MRTHCLTPTDDSHAEHLAEVRAGMWTAPIDLTRMADEASDTDERRADRTWI